MDKSGRKRLAEPHIEPSISKRQKKSKKIKKGGEAADDEEFDTNLQIRKATGHMDGNLLADYMAQQLKRAIPDASIIELEDCRIPESAFVDTTQWPHTRTLENLPRFIETFSGKSEVDLSKSAEGEGSPHTIVVCAAALRAADATRVLRKYQTKSATVSKLFAKHIKLKDAIAMTSNTRMAIGVGTAQRLIDLINAGSLRLESLERFVIDVSWCGPKKRTVLDMRETVVPLLQLLTRRDVKDRYGLPQKEKLSVLTF